MPLPTTVLDLWTLIYDHKCKTIVMINPLNPLDEVSNQIYIEYPFTLRVSD